MQLHACLLLFFFTTDKTMALFHQRCGGNLTLDQGSAGSIILLSPGLFNLTSRLSPMSQQSEESVLLSNCTWVLGMPLGRKVLLKLKWIKSDWRISLRCGEEDRILQSLGESLWLSDCEENKAVLSWTGPGISLDSIQLTYYVQEDGRNSSEGQSTHQRDQDSTGWSVTETTYKRVTADAQKLVKGTEENRSSVYGGQTWSFATQPAASASSQDEGLLQSTSFQWGLPVAGRTDRETLPLPEEKRNNAADASGAAHLADSPMTTTTHPYFQPAVSTVTKSLTEKDSGLTQGQTETSWTDKNASLSIRTYLQKSTPAEMLTKTEEPVAKMDERAAVQMNQSVSSFSVNSSLSGILMSDSNTSIDPYGGAIGQASGDQQAPSDEVYSALTTTSKRLEPSIKLPQPTLPSLSSPQGSTHMAQSPTAAVTVEVASLQPSTAQGDSSASDSTTQRDAVKSTDSLYNTDGFNMVTPSTQCQTDSLENTERRSAETQTSRIDTQTATEDMQRDERNFYVTTNLISTLFNMDESPSTIRPERIVKVKTSSAAPTVREPQTLLSTTDSPTVSSAVPYALQTTQTGHPGGPQMTFSSPVAESSSVDPKTPSESPQTFHLLLPSSPAVSPNKQFNITANTPRRSVDSDIEDVKETTPRRWFPSDTMTQNPPAGPAQDFHQVPFSATSLTLTPTPKGSSTKSPIYYIVPNQPATIRVESVELLLRIALEDCRSALTAGLEEDILAWLKSYLQRALGFTKLQGVWSSGHAVQSLAVFQTDEALQWLSLSGPTSLLERTGLAQAVRQGKTFGSSRVTNITVEGLQGDVCDWLLQCPSGYKCVPQPGTTNYSCSSACRFDYCHHHGICTHHPGQLPVCRCLVGNDFWYMGQRCDMRMTQARLISACLAVLIIIVMVVSVLAYLAVRRYRAILIQAKVDQTRSSYRRFNHFDELSGRFWLRSWPGSTDSLDNPAYMRSDELLHLRALDRPCCYHDDSLSLPSTCPSHGTRINTIYPHSSQYGWRGSGMSVGDGVLDSGKASDLSVCSWPVEPIHWTPFPLLQQLASHRNPAVRMSRPRSYCEGMELVDLGKSWTA